jgi:hypothetical protein
MLRPESELQNHTKKIEAAGEVAEGSTIAKLSEYAWLPLVLFGIVKLVIT